MVNARDAGTAGDLGTLTLILTLSITLTLALALALAKASLCPQVGPLHDLEEAALCSAHTAGAPIRGGGYSLGQGYK